MDVYEAMGRLANALERRWWPYETVAGVMDDICKLPTRMEKEIEVAWLAYKCDLLDVIAAKEVGAEKRETALQVA